MPGAGTSSEGLGAAGSVLASGMGSASGASRSLAVALAGEAGASSLAAEPADRRTPTTNNANAPTTPIETSTRFGDRAGTARCPEVSS